MDKEYFRREYALAVSDWKAARDTEGRQQATDQAAKVYNLAAQIFGFEFAEGLRAEYPCTAKAQTTKKARNDMQR